MYYRICFGKERRLAAKYSWIKADKAFKIRNEKMTVKEKNLLYWQYSGFFFYYLDINSDKITIKSTGLLYKSKEIRI